MLYNKTCLANVEPDEDDDDDEDCGDFGC